MEKISAVYRITNTITNDFYIGSSKNVKKRWADHKCQSTWNEHPNKQLYLDMKRYGVDKFIFQVIAEVKPESLKEAEQQFIENLKPTYNSNRANGWDIERYKKYKKEYNNEYNKSDIRKESNNKYQNQLCCFNGQTLTLHALSMRFMRQGIDHPAQEAKKYLIGGNDD